MAKLLFRLGRFSYRKKWLVLLIWLLVIAGMGGSAAKFQKGFDNLFLIPGTASEAASNLLAENFPEQKDPLANTGVTIVFKAPDGHRIDEPQYMVGMDATVNYLRDHLLGEMTDLQRFGNPVLVNEKIRKLIMDGGAAQGMPEETSAVNAKALSLVSPDGTIGFTTFSFDVPVPDDVTQPMRDVINEAMDQGREAGLQVEGGGPAFGDPIVIKSTSEMVGLGVAFLVLLFTFGSLIAAGLPLIVAMVGISIGSSAILLATHFMRLNDVTPVLALMLGLAVGVDYALFILSRYRAEMNRAPRDEAAGMAVGTAGSAVVFAGLTVIIALVALVVVDIPFLTSMGLAAAFTVFVAVWVALTLLPAILGVLGRHAFGLRLPFLGKKRSREFAEAVHVPVSDGSIDLDASSEHNLIGFVENKLKLPNLAEHSRPGQLWVKFVQKWPALTLGFVVLILVGLTSPALRLELALPTDSTSEYATTQRKSADLLEEAFGPGINAPFLVIVDAHNVNPTNPAIKPLVDVQREMAERDGRPFTQRDVAKAAAGAAFFRVLNSYGANVDVANIQAVGLSQDGMAAQMLITPVTGPVDPLTQKILGSLRTSEDEIEASTGAVIGITGLTPIQQDVTERLAGAMPLYLAVVVGLAVVLLLLVFRSIVVPLVAGAGYLLSVGAAFGTTVLFWQEGLWGLVPTPAPIISFMPIFLIGITFGLAMDYQVFLVSRMREHFTKSHGEASDDHPYNAVEESVIEGFSLGFKVVTAAALIMISVFVAFIDQPLPFIKIFGFALGMGVLFDAFFVRMGLVPAAMFLLGRATWWIPRWLDKILPVLDIEGEKLEDEWLERSDELAAAHEREIAAIKAKEERKAEKKHRRLAKAGRTTHLTDT